MENTKELPPDESMGCATPTNNRLDAKIFRIGCDMASEDSQHLSNSREEIIRCLAKTQCANEDLRAELDRWKRAARSIEGALQAIDVRCDPDSVVALVRSRAAHFANIRMAMGSALALIADDASWITESVTNISQNGNTIQDVARKAAEYGRQPAPDPFTLGCCAEMTPELKKQMEGRMKRKEQPPYTEEELRAGKLTPEVIKENL